MSSATCIADSFRRMRRRQPFSRLCLRTESEAWGGCYVTDWSTGCQGKRQLLEDQLYYQYGGIFIMITTIVEKTEN